MAEEDYIDLLERRNKYLTDLLRRLVDAVPFEARQEDMFLDRRWSEAKQYLGS
jgi:hypothetical protein